MLLERRELLFNDMRGLEAAEAREAADIPRRSSHLADLGSDRAASDVSLGRRESECEEIQEIDDALDRVRDGSFGLCEDCELRIPKARLEAIPYARLCLVCKMREES
jgi:DnaK suppressor protein